VATGRFHWWLTNLKDACIAIPSVVMIFLQSSGLFNSCYCWGSAWSRGPDAYVQLDPDKDRKHNAETIYPALVWACLGLQAAVFLLALRISKRGRSMTRRDEETKMKDFWVVHKGNDARPEGKGGSGFGDQKAGRDVERFGVLPPPAMEVEPFLKK
jgi:hypothetical protein